VSTYPHFFAIDAYTRESLTAVELIVEETVDTWTRQAFVLVNTISALWTRPGLDGLSVEAQPMALGGTVRPVSPGGVCHTGSDEKESGLKMPSGRPRPARRCRAHRTNGQPCEAYAMVGGFVCSAHGGRAPHVRAAAARRFADAKAQHKMNVEVPLFLARLAEEDRARREWVADVLGLDDPNDPRTSCGLHVAAAHFITDATGAAQ
jgi:hypothetical protein